MERPIYFPPWGFGGRRKWRGVKRRSEPKNPRWGFEACFIFDKIPLIQKLKLRSVATANIAYGSFNHSRNGVYDKESNPEGIIAPNDLSGIPVIGFKTLDPGKPYIEVSYGIENIFRVFRLDAIHRLTYLSSEEPFGKPRKFGIKISAAFRF